MPSKDAPFANAYAAGITTAGSLNSMPSNTSGVSGVVSSGVVVSGVITSGVVSSGVVVSGVVYSGVVWVIPARMPFTRSFTLQPVVNSVVVSIRTANNKERIFLEWFMMRISFLNFLKDIPIII